MGNNNKTYRIRTTVGHEADSFIDVHLDQDYDSLEILSLKISDKDVYKLHNSDYGVVVGRVLANGNFGVPNAKISVFIPADEQNEDMKMWNLYPYTSTTTKNDKDIRYNLLPDESVKDCHKAVGTFPNKTYLLENDSLLEVFDKYYVYTTRTNAAGDYLICGVPTGMQTLHMDLDLSDCGILSQRPRDFVYKGYTIEQFENPNQFKKDENIDGLSQIFSQNQPVYVKPFWGNENNGDEIGITRADIEISFKFEPTCVFMGSAISDNPSNGVGKKCVPTNQMGAMDELTAGEGTIEMIRKTPDGNVEEFSIKGNQLINGNGVWCYQIPMNLDYMMTDEYGNMVPTDDPEKGIPTRTRVRFRASLTDMENSSQSYYRAKYLIPNNPAIDSEKVDYNFGTYTEEDSYRDLFWNGVYTVKSYIPRFQKSKRWKNERFSGIKACNYYSGNNPMPYNNMRIRLPFMFTVLCIFVKLFMKVVTIVNRILTGIIKITIGAKNKISKNAIHCMYIGDGLCPDMEGWYFAPACAQNIKRSAVRDLLIKNTLAAAKGNGIAPDTADDKTLLSSSQYTDETSIDVQNRTTDEEESVCLTRNVDYLLNCFEMNLAQEYRVIKFDFYNDWVNGVIYFPRWMRKVKRKKKYKFSLKNGVSTYYKDKVQGCMNSENSRVKKTRYYTQQCSLEYTGSTNSPWAKVTTERTCNSVRKRNAESIFPARCHKKKGMTQSSIFGRKSGLVTEQTTMFGQFVYYLKPCEWSKKDNTTKRTLLFATDIVLLGTLNNCDEHGIPQAFKYLNNTSYIMPTNLALTTMDDDPYIYAKDDGTVCLSGSIPKTSDFKDSVLRVTPSYSATSVAYSKTEDDKLEYTENDDPIPVTEAAGITWNYSGPGQDDVLAGLREKPSNLTQRLFGKTNKSYNFLYYPGGHFLGLSCVNSETNIKSCVNLKRICEMGATMSQRREEVRGYNNENGMPKYRYYVPTGLISNVDIEGASFRSMFATMNHNKLVATRTSDETGYKYYDFRFLRPDGFDGALAQYVHDGNSSPYNRKVNEGTISAPDETSIFHKMFPSWSEPDDYDSEESAYTETRTIEDTVNDYYMFRFGLNSFNDNEQKTHFLGKTTRGYTLPQYENSFYFYFGLKDGSTALDEFKKQFFSECKTNNITKAPQVNVIEEIDESLNGNATFIIDNMVGPYAITGVDDTTGYKVTGGTNDDNFTFIDLFGKAPVIGHIYTLTITDSLERTTVKTFIFGSNAVVTDIDVVHFRYDRSARSTREADIKFGGYIRISDNIKILNNEYSISEASNIISFKLTNGSSIVELQETDSYVDTDGKLWHIYPIDNIGSYDLHLIYNGSNTVINTFNIEDNSDVELYVGCDYLGYKSGYGLSGVTESDWLNAQNLFGRDTRDSWLLKHTYYRQLEDNSEGFDSYIYASKSNYDIAVFGWPEQGGLTDEGTVLKNTFAKNDYESYEGYSIETSWSFIPTMYWNPETHQMDNMSGRNPFDVMAYSDDGRAAADVTKISVISISQSGSNLIIECSGPSVNGISVGHGSVIVFENKIVIFPVISEITGNQIKMICYNTEDPYGTITNQEQRQKLLSYAAIYPTLRVPVIYKPFFAEISAATWNLYDLTLITDENNVSSVQKVELPISYKVEGVIHNGLTSNGLFYSGETADTQEEQTYATYMIDNTKRNFYESLTTESDKDYTYDRNFSFGAGVIDGFSREITKYVEESEDSETKNDITDISYNITEGLPSISDTDPDRNKIFSGRYNGGFDAVSLNDTCDLSESFHRGLKIFSVTTDGTEGQCAFASDNIPSSAETEIRITNTPLFIDNGVAEINTSFWTANYLYGTYNSAALYDPKGSSVTVKESLGAYTFQKTDSDGIKKNYTVWNINDLESCGVTLLHKFTLDSAYKENISEIENVFEKATAFSVASLINGIPYGVGGTDYTLFHNLSNQQTVIEKYKRPDESGTNKMVVYKLYPLRLLDIIYPPVQGDGNV